MPPRISIPPALAVGPFTVAQGRSLGLGRDRLLGPDLARPFHGVRVSVPIGPVAAESASPTRDPDSAATELGGVLARARVEALCRAYATIMRPGQFFSHTTAAVLLGIPLPADVEGRDTVHVTIRAPARAQRGRGLIGHRIADPDVAVAMVRGFPVEDGATVFCHLAATLGVADLVAVGDYLVRRRSREGPLPPGGGDRFTLAALNERVQRYRGRGVVRARSAVDLVRVGAESRAESLLRFALVGAGLPEPELNIDIFDHERRFIARVDLLYRRWQIVVEYDGDQHRVDNAQYDKDCLRLEALAAAGWTVIRVRSAFFARPEQTLARVRAALVRSGWTP